MSASSKVLVVGEAPSRWMKENGVTLPLPIARRELAALSGMVPHQWNQLFECVNVLDEWPGRGPNGKNDDFPFALARPAAVQMLDSMWGRLVILLGRRVEAAFHFEPMQAPWFEQRTVPDPRPGAGVGTKLFNYVVAPHPSKASRWWNSAENHRAAAIFWGELAKDQLAKQAALAGNT